MNIPDNENLDFLQRATVSHILKSEPNKHLVAGKTKAVKIWSRIKPKETEGIIIGKRTLCSGIEDYFSAYLVVFNMRENPVYVLPADLSTERKPKYNNDSYSFDVVTRPNMEIGYEIIEAFDKIGEGEN
jgi:hypothetical protein